MKVVYALCCCCFCIRRKSKAIVAPQSSVNGNEFLPKCGRVRMQTAANRLIAVLTLTSDPARSNSSMQNVPNLHNAQNASDGRKGKKFEISEPDKTSIGSASLRRMQRQSISSCNSSSSSSEMAGNSVRVKKTVVVKVDVERPKTTETISSRVSLPPLHNSPSRTSVRNKIGKKLKWNLRAKKRLQENENVHTAQVQGENAKNPCTMHDCNSKLQNAWKDEIVELPGANSANENETSLANATDGEDEKSRKHFRESHHADWLSTVEKCKVTMFFLHGVGGQSGAWRHQINFFHQMGLNIISMDMIGHGDSSAPSSRSNYTFDAIKTDVFAVFDRFARENNVIVAHSYGTCFAAVLARERHEKITHLVMVSSGAPVPLDPSDGIFALPATILALLRPALDRNFLKRAFATKPSEHDFQMAFGAVHTGALRDIMRGQKWSEGTVLYHQQIRTPTLLVYGSADEFVSLEEMHEMRKAVPHSVLEVVEQASHMVMLEQPEQVNKLIEEFLRKASNEKDEPEEAPKNGYEKLVRRPQTAVSRTIPPSNMFRLQSENRTHTTHIIAEA